MRTGTGAVETAPVFVGRQGIGMSKLMVNYPVIGQALPGQVD